MMMMLMLGKTESSLSSTIGREAWNPIEGSLSLIAAQLNWEILTFVEHRRLSKQFDR